MKTIFFSAAILGISWVAISLTREASAGEKQEAGFQGLFDGQTLKGWHASAQTGHSRASGNKSGGRWVVENDAIVGSQDIPGNGGILLSDEQFGDFEIVLEMNNDFGPDSGLFLRSDEQGTCYQAMIDYHGGGNLMGLYGEGGLGAKPSVLNFSFLDRPDRIKLVTENKGVPVPVAFPMPLEDWPKFWKHGQWNELRARIVGNPPHITTWIKDVKFMDWTETEKRHPDKGSIGLQVHGGGDFTKQFVRYRNIRLKRLDQSNAKTNVLILVGGHGFDQASFDKFWSGNDDINSRIWQGSPYTAFDDISQVKADVIVMYNLSSGMTEKQKQNFLKLLEQGVGLVVWHHALANCQDWSEFEKIAGAKFWLQPGERNGVEVAKSGTGYGTVKLHIEDPNHPVTKGLSDFELTDEPYNQQTFSDGIHALVTTNHPQSDKTIAWVHEYGKARVFGCQSGHDAKVWTNDSFRRLMAQAIRWAGSRLPGAEGK